MKEDLDRDETTNMNGIDLTEPIHHGCDNLIGCFSEPEFRCA